MGGMALFTAASLVCGLSTSDEMLIIARAVQGLGAAIVTPSALSIISTTFTEGSERNKALGAWGAVAGSGAAAGVLFGGILTKYLGWEWIFWVNVPVGLARARLDTDLRPREPARGRRARLRPTRRDPGHLGSRRSRLRDLTGARQGLGVVRDDRCARALRSATRGLPALGGARACPSDAVAHLPHPPSLGRQLHRAAAVGRHLRLVLAADALHARGAATVGAPDRESDSSPRQGRLSSSPGPRRRSSRGSA